MNYLRGIFFLGYFFAAGFYGSIIILILGKKRSAALDVFSRYSQYALNMAKINIKLDGAEHLPSNGFVAVHNETSWPDIIALQATLYNNYVDHAAVASQYGMIPFMKAACKAAGILLVPRGNRAGVDKVLNELVEYLKGGERVVFGGEGRLSGIDGVMRFKQGSALLAIRSGKPLIPIAFHGGQLLMPLQSCALIPGTIRIRFGAPIVSEGLSDKDARMLVDQAQAAVSKLYKALSEEK
ncbi:lysophospholipid acyltransferase family protein [Colwellia piezophila]|uniref:lysophospholipid acyltransferase family protein n=1 Tax=Colwellia piezophila TaxID=211668 RepID=UPI000372EBC1|nr:lysophospholipid acyltransferase family protein [Colwellia piezophila]